MIQRNPLYKAPIDHPDSDIKYATDYFETVDGGLLSKCQINLVPVQSGSGDPSPDNVRPISGHTEVDLYNVGKNRQVLTVEDIKSVSTGVTWVGNSCVLNNVTYTILTNSKNEVVGIKTNGTASELSQITISKTYVKEGSYTFSSGVTGSNSTYYMRYVVRDSNGTAISIDGSLFIDVYNNETTKALPSNASYVNGYIGVINGVQANNLVFKPMIRLATETDSTFEPYLGHLYTINLGGTYYGGYLDVASGELTIDKWYVQITAQNVTFDSTNNRGLIRTNLVGIPYAISSPYTVNCICDKFEGITQTSGIVTGNVGVYAHGQIIAICGYKTSLEDYQSWLTDNPVTVVYEIEAPQTIQLTPQQVEALVGQNNLSCPLEGQSLETNGTEYKELFTISDVKELIAEKVPDAPTTDGTYTLTATVSSGVATYSWT